MTKDNEGLNDIPRFRADPPEIRAMSQPKPAQKASILRF